MRRHLLLAILILTASLSVRAQVACGFGGEENFSKTEQVLKQTKSCREAAKTLRACAWGSSADSMFASVVIPKCEQEFRYSLTAAEDRRYVQERRFCGYEYEKQGGTMSISAAALCEVNVSEFYATRPERRSDQPLRASFDCALAKSDVEKTICADEKLGEADIVLSRVYNESLRSKAFEFSTELRVDQRKWLATLPAACEPVHSDQTKFSKCLREQIESRFTQVGVCRFSAENEDSWTAPKYLKCLRDTSSDN